MLPAVASAKVDFRLVSDLTPALVRRIVREHLDRRGFSDVELVPHHGEGQQRWIEVTPVSPRCALGRSKTRTTSQPA